MGAVLPGGPVVSDFRSQLGNLRRSADNFLAVQDRARGVYSHPGPDLPTPVRAPSKGVPAFRALVLWNSLLVGFTVMRQGSRVNEYESTTQCDACRKFTRKGNWESEAVRFRKHAREQYRIRFAPGNKHTPLVSIILNTNFEGAIAVFTMGPLTTGCLNVSARSQKSGTDPPDICTQVLVPYTDLALLPRGQVQIFRQR
ncbi:hypothetical protein BJX99DRAFT_254874 [Aspergillus californicus]